MQKMPPKSSKNEMLIFLLCSTSDDQLSDPSNKSVQKCTTKVPQNDLEWPILPNSQRFQSFPSKVAQDNSEQPILPDSQLFQSFPTEVDQNDSKWPILHGKKKNKTKNIMIQGNFFERLHFYMDSCAIVLMYPNYSQTCLIPTLLIHFCLICCYPLEPLFTH